LARYFSRIRREYIGELFSVGVPFRLDRLADLGIGNDFRWLSHLPILILRHPAKPPILDAPRVIMATAMLSDAVTDCAGEISMEPMLANAESGCTQYRSIPFGSEITTWPPNQPFSSPKCSGDMFRQARDDARNGPGYGSRHFRSNKFLPGPMPIMSGRANGRQQPPDVYPMCQTKRGRGFAGRSPMAAVACLAVALWPSYWRNSGGHGTGRHCPDWPSSRSWPGRTPTIGAQADGRPIGRGAFQDRPAKRGRGFRTLCLRDAGDCLPGCP